MIKKYSVILLLSSCLFSCSKKVFDIQGKYNSVEKIGVFSKLKYDAYIIGVELHLYENQTFLYSNCSQRTIGKWEKSDNLIFLHCEKTEPKHSDSLNLLSISCSEIPLIFKVKRNFLINIYDTGDQKLIEKLKKEN